MLEYRLKPHLLWMWFFCYDTIVILNLFQNLFDVSLLIKDSVAQTLWSGFLLNDTRFSIGILSRHFRTFCIHLSQSTNSFPVKGRCPDRSVRTEGLNQPPRLLLSQNPLLLAKEETYYYLIFSHYYTAL